MRSWAVAPRRLFAQSLTMMHDDSLLPGAGPLRRGPRDYSSDRNASGLYWPGVVLRIRHASLRLGPRRTLQYVRASLRSHYCVAWSMHPRNPMPAMHLVY